MSTPQFTPAWTAGPWRIIKADACMIMGRTSAYGQHDNIRGGWPEEATLALVAKAFFPSHWEANAHLIAAAPSLYEAAQRVLDASEALESPYSDEISAKSALVDAESALRLALSRARGELP